MIKINLIKTNNIMGNDFFSGAIRCKDLLGSLDNPNFIIPEYKPWDPTDLKGGYQRKAKEKRIKDVKDRILKDPSSIEALVDSINLNVRRNEVRTQCKPLNKDKNGFGDFYVYEHLEPRSGNEEHYDDRFWVVDGQTRLKGMQEALATAKSERNIAVAAEIENTYINITLTLSEDFFFEAYIFYLINQHSASIPPEGASRLLYGGYKNKIPNFHNEITGDGSNLKPVDMLSMQVADQLKADSNIWSSRIRDFNEVDGKKISVRAVAMQMVKPLLNKVDTVVRQSATKNPDSRTTNITFNVMEAYWNAIDKIFPAMFVQATKHHYGITKSSQAEVMMRVCAAIYLLNQTEWTERYNHKLRNLEDEKVWIKLLKAPLEKFKDVNGGNSSVKGSECWYVGKGGSMGRYTSGAAKGEIATKLVDAIKHGIGIQTIKV